MRVLAIFLLVGAIGCKPKPIAKRVPGTWLIEHYDEYTAGRSTGHLFDRAGSIAFYKDGTGEKNLAPQKPVGALATPVRFRYTVTNADSLVRIFDLQSGEERERWIVTSNYPTYQEWVSVNPARDTVRTMYLMRRYAGSRTK